MNDPTSGKNSAVAAKPANPALSGETVEAPPSPVTVLPSQPEPCDADSSDATFCELD